LVIAVTGASGFIGRHLVAHLGDRGVEVATVQRPFERNALTAALRGAGAVVHLAGVVSALRSEDFFAANVAGTRAVAEAARAAGSRMIHVSSLAAAGPAPPAAPRSEDDEPDPLTPYGRSKLESERVLAAMPDLRWVVLRPGMVYGPGDRAMLPLFRAAARGVLPLVGHESAAYTVIYISDLVRALAAALDSDATTVNRDVMFAGHPRPATAREMLEGVRSAVGHRAAIVRVPMAVTRLAAIAGDLVGAARGRPTAINRSRYTELAAEGFVCRVDRLRDRLGIVAQVELQDGLAKTAAWYRSEGWL
jgi:nucleoside-diphosphate-sugar epimerase